MKNVTFASYDAVKAARRAKENDRQAKAMEAEFKANIDAEDEEPKAKRPKRSCTKTRRGGSA